MKKMNKLVLLGCLVLILAIAFAICSKLDFNKRSETIIEIDHQFVCEEESGTWLEEFNECEYISELVCNELGGMFNECDSACRNDEEAEICTLQCVQVCSFDEVLPE